MYVLYDEKAPQQWLQSIGFTGNTQKAPQQWLQSWIFEVPDFGDGIGQHDDEGSEKVPITAVTSMPNLRKPVYAKVVHVMKAWWM